MEKEILELEHNKAEIINKIENLMEQQFSLVGIEISKNEKKIHFRNHEQKYNIRRIISSMYTDKELGIEIDFTAPVIMSGINDIKTGHNRFQIEFDFDCGEIILQQVLRNYTVELDLLQQAILIISEVLSKKKKFITDN